MKKPLLGLREGKYVFYNLTEEENTELLKELDKKGLKSRADRMNGDISHEDYYAQFVTENTKRNVLRCIGKNRLLSSTDEYLNDIPLRMWDATPLNCINTSICGESLSPSTKVCILKNAGRQLIKELV